MLSTLIKKELLAHMLEFRFAITTALCVILAIISVSVLKMDLATKKHDFEGNQTIYQQQAEEYGDYRQLQRQGVKVDRPPQVFQMLFYGMEKTPDRTAEVSGDFVEGFEGNPNANPAVLLFPVADMLFIVAAVISLLAFFFSYDGISGERERGTLKLLMSYSVPRDQVILAKWIGGYLSLALPFLISLLIAALLILPSRDAAFTTADWGAFGLSALAAMLFIAVMFSVGLFVSTRCARSSTAITTLLMIWVLLALIVPNASPYIADRLSPIPSIGNVEREIKEKVRSLSEEFRSSWSQLRRGGRRLQGAARAEAFQKIREQREELRRETNETTEEIIRSFERKLGKQINVARALSRISPSSSYIYASTDIGGTGIQNEGRLIASLRTYQREFSQYVEVKMEESGQESGWWGSSDDDEEYDISDMPEFNYTSEEVPVRASSRMPDILLLAIYAVVFFMGTFLSFVRMDII